MQLEKPKLNQLAMYRRRMGYTQREVSRLLGSTDASMVSHYECGRCLPSFLGALRLEIILRVPVAFLFPGLYDELKREIRDKEDRGPQPGQQAMFSPTNSPQP